ncbi:hypothetical protein BH24ACT3_BH24ACT3_19780 [soil metagenome]
MATSRPPLDEHNLIATFPDGEAAREAMVALEQQGIEAGDVTLLSGPSAAVTGGAARAEDMAVTGEVAKRYGVGGAIGAVIGALIVVGVVNLAGIEPRAAVSVGGALAGAIGGFFLGGYWGAAKGLPVNDDVFDTYLPEGSDHVGVVVAVGDDAKAARAAEVLSDTGALKVDRLARQGRPIDADPRG